MMRHLCAAILLLAVTLANAQSTDFNLLGQRLPMFYLDSSEMAAIHADSVKIIGTDTVTYLYAYVDTFNTGANCDLHAYSTHWMGPQVGQKMFNRQYLLNRDDDTLWFNIRRGLGDSFTLYRYPDSSYIEAVAKVNTTMAVAQIVDDVQILELRVRSKTDSLIQHHFSGKEVWLSRNYGFLQSYRWYHFPYDTTLVYWRGPTVFAGQGVDTGETQLDANRIWRIREGDELHYLDRKTDCRQACQVVTIKEKLLCVQFDTVIPSHLRWIYRRTRDIKDSSSSGVILTTLRDTFFYTLNPYDYFFLDSFHRRLFIRDGQPGYSVHKFIDSLGNRLMKDVQMDDKYDPADSCFTQMPDSVLEVYGDGLGLALSYTDSAGLVRKLRKLVYYQKGLASWGTPWTFPSSTAEIRAAMLELYPNPASGDMITAAIDFAVTQVNLMAMDGRQFVANFHQQGPTVSINLDGFRPGVYLITAIGTSGQQLTGRLSLF